MWHFDTLALISYFDAGNFVIRGHFDMGGGDFSNTPQN